MLKKRHDFKFEAENIRELDYLLPRLKYAVNLSKVIRWLENFEEKDLPKALQILSVVEYIDFNELNYRMDEHNTHLLKQKLSFNKLLSSGVEAQLSTLYNHLRN